MKDSSDEVGELARAFDPTAAQLVEVQSRLKQRVTELAGLVEAGHLLTGTLELSEVLQRLTEIIQSRLGVDVVLIWLRDETAGSVVLRAHRGIARWDAGFRTRLALEEGFAASWIMTRRTPLVVGDVLTEPRLRNREWMKAEGIISFLGVPLLREDASVGILTCMSRERRDFSPPEVTLAEALATQAAIAIENARLHGEIRGQARAAEERNRQLQFLHEVARAISAERDLDRLLQAIVTSATGLLGATYGALAVFDADGRIRQLFIEGLAPEERERIGRLPEGRGLLGEVFKRGLALRVDDLTTHPAAVGFPPGHPPMRSLLAMPIRFGEEALGALYLTEKPGGFTAGDESVLGTLCADAAVAIENARLMGDLRQALEDVKTSQERLVRTETLRAVGELASGMAHHLNNILAVIGGRVQLLLQRVEEPSVRRSLEIVARAVANGAEVIRGVQGFSRGRPPAETIAVDLNQLVREVLELTRPRWTDQAQAEGISIEASLEPGEIPAVAGDPASLTEVLVNLLLNAVEALPSGGRITVRTWASGPWVHCSVSDTGVGMSEEVRLRALEPFFTTKGPKNTGLGLSVAHGTVQRHGGRLEIESAEGKGTTVTISLPVAPTGPVAEPARVPRRTSVGPRRILVIDDEAEVREVLAELLASQGHAVSQAASGAEGVSLFQTDRNDIVFTDLGMPGMTGWQVAGAIKALSPATPVVLVTGWADEIPRPGAQAGPVDQIISKPFDANALAEVLATLLAGSPG